MIGTLVNWIPKSKIFFTCLPLSQGMGAWGILRVMLHLNLLQDCCVKCKSFRVPEQEERVVEQRAQQWL